MYSVQDALLRIECWYCTCGLARSVRHLWRVCVTRWTCDDTTCMDHPPQFQPGPTLLDFGYPGTSEARYTGFIRGFSNAGSAGNRHCTDITARLQRPRYSSIPWKGAMCMHGVMYFWGQFVAECRNEGHAKCKVILPKCNTKIFFKAMVTGHNIYNCFVFKRSVLPDRKPSTLNCKHNIFPQFFFWD